MTGNETSNNRRFSDGIASINNATAARCQRRAHVRPAVISLAERTPPSCLFFASIWANGQIGTIKSSCAGGRTGKTCWGIFKHRAVSSKYIETVICVATIAAFFNPTRG
jgi:hypothetical protein